MTLNDIASIVEEKGFAEIDYNIFSDATQTSFGEDPNLIDRAFLNLCLRDMGGKPIEHLTLEEKAERFFDDHKMRFIYDREKRTYSVSKRGDELNNLGYQKWVEDNVKDGGYGDCHEISEKMAAEFKELKAVKGFYHCLIWGKRMHGWCVDTKSNIIDPTKNQFPSKGSGEYEEVEEENRPTGRCNNCGELTYNIKNASYCNDSCQSSYAEYINSGRI